MSWGHLQEHGELEGSCITKSQSQAGGSSGTLKARAPYGLPQTSPGLPSVSASLNSAAAHPFLLRNLWEGGAWASGKFQTPCKEFAAYFLSPKEPPLWDRSFPREEIAALQSPINTAHPRD